MFAAAVTDSYPEPELSTPHPLTFFLYIGHTFFSETEFAVFFVQNLKPKFLVFSTQGVNIFFSFT